MKVKEKNNLHLIGVVVLSILLVVMLFSSKIYRPPYRNVEDATEYLWRQMAYKADRAIVLSADSILTISAFIEKDEMLNIHRKALEMKLRVNDLEDREVYLQEYSGIWGVYSSKKDSQMVVLAYKNFKK